MNKIILYSTGCPRCNVLKKKLDAANIQYELNTNIEEMERLGLQFLPVLSVNGKTLEFVEAINWTKEQEENGHSR